jgi:outer membrane lipoprotein-sorting protein
MKNVILFATLAITAIGCAQSKDKKEVPKVVKEVFKRISKYEGRLGYGDRWF